MTLGNNLTTWNIVCGLAIVVMVGAACFELAAPKPSAQAEIKKLDGKRKLLLVRDRAVQVEMEKAKANLAAYIRKNTAADTAPIVLSDLNTLAKAAGVNLTNFRPGRTTVSGDVTVVPFDVTATGTYNQLVTFMRKTEEPDHLLAVNSIQITNSEGAGDQISATLSFVTLVSTPKPPASASPTPTRSGATNGQVK